MRPAVIYLIHFTRPFVTGRRSCQHYLGSTVCFDSRMEQHRKSRGARLLALVNKAGITWGVVRTWETTASERYAEERRLKRSHHGYKNLCPVCRGVNYHALPQVQ
jgi:predicted GIY-YIG superfamily endonuclease